MPAGFRHTLPMVATATKLEPKGRLTAAHWEQAALDTLAESGLGAVAVESLARRLGVTKGSFYWHFPTREALIKAALERWERGDEEVVMAQVEDDRRSARAPARVVPPRQPRDAVARDLCGADAVARSSAGAAGHGARLAAAPRCAHARLSPGRPRARDGGAPRPACLLRLHRLSSAFAARWACRGSAMKNSRVTSTTSSRRWSRPEKTPERLAADRLAMVTRPPLPSGHPFASEALPEAPLRQNVQQTPSVEPMGRRGRPTYPARCRALVRRLRGRKQRARSSRWSATAR